MNRVILMGRLTREPDIRYTQGENPMCVARYTLAVDRRFSRSNNEGNNADFISCVAFGRSGEFAEKYLHKGTKIAVTGRIQTGSYTNRDGVKVYTTDVVVEDHEFVESKRAAAAGGYDNGSGSYGNNGGSYGRNSGGYNSGSYGGGNSHDGNSGNGGYSTDRGNADSGNENSGSVNGNGNQNDDLNGFMNIPDGIDEELPFA